MTFLSKTAGVLSLTSAIVDMHKTAVIASNREYNKASANAVIKSSLSAQKTESISHKDSNRKNYLSRHNFTASSKELIGRVKGYFKGLAAAFVRYIPNFIAGGFALFFNSKNPNAEKAMKTNETVAIISTIALACIEVYDFIRKSSGIFERNDYLE